MAHKDHTRLMELALTSGMPAGAQRERQDALEYLTEYTAELENSRLRLIAIVGELGLRSCKKCGYYHLSGHICYECGYDPSCPEEEN